MIDWDTFAFKVGPVLLTAVVAAVVLILLGLASIAFREAISPTQPAPQPARCCPCHAR